MARMGEPAWWIGALEKGAVALALVVVMGWLGRSRTTASSPEARVLRYPRGIWWIGVVATAIFGGFATLMLFLATNGLRLAAAFIPFIALGAYLVADYYATSFELMPDGFRFRLLHKGRGVVHWTQIERVEWSEIAKWWVIRTVHGDKIRLSAGLQGLPALATALLENVVAHRYTPKAHELMRETAAGRPPALYH
jgi:hypothetical protein